MNRIKAGQGNPNQEVENIVFYTDPNNWPQRLYEQFTDPNPDARFDPPLAANYNIGFLFASGPFRLEAGQDRAVQPRAWRRAQISTSFVGPCGPSSRSTTRTTSSPCRRPMPTVTAESGDGYVRLSWDDVAERGSRPRDRTE